MQSVSSRGLVISLSRVTAGRRCTTAVDYVASSDRIRHVLIEARERDLVTTRRRQAAPCGMS